MANRHGLRSTWLSFHKWIGLTLALVIVPLSLSGSALVWQDWLDDATSPQRQISGNGEAVLKPSAYVQAVKSGQQPISAISSLTFRDRRAAIAVARLAPDSQRISIWIDPANGKLLDADTGSSGLIDQLHSFHASLFIPVVGHLVVGIVGAAMLISSLTGLWLWWPISGGLRSGLRWRRTKSTLANMHHQVGFWMFLPLGMLSFTGIWLVFSPFFAVFSADAERAKSESDARWWANPLAITSMNADEAATAALAVSPGKLVSIVWPTDFEAKWRIKIVESGKSKEVMVIDATGEAERDADLKDGGVNRAIGRMHAGSGMGLLWQVAIFVGGLMPLVLGTTGLVMWWRSRGWRADVARRMGGRKPG